MTQDCMITFAKNIQQAYACYCQPLLAKYDLLQMSFDILMFLSTCPDGCTAKEISDLRCVKTNVISVHVEKLADAGLLKRGTVAGDRRKVMLCCTEKAQPIIREGQALYKSLYQDMMCGIPEENLCLFKNILLNINENAIRIRKEAYTV